MSRAVATGALANAAALACVVVAYLRRDDVTIEGAYSNESVGVSSEKLVLTYGTAPWLLAAGVLLLVGTTVLVRVATRRR